MKCCTVLHRANISQITSDHATPIRAVARALIGGGGGVGGGEYSRFRVMPD